MVDTLKHLHVYAELIEACHNFVGEVWVWSTRHYILCFQSASDRVFHDVAMARAAISFCPNLTGFETHKAPRKIISWTSEIMTSSLWSEGCWRFPRVSVIRWSQSASAVPDYIFFCMHIGNGSCLLFWKIAVRQISKTLNCDLWVFSLIICYKT